MITAVRPISTSIHMTMTKGSHPRSAVRQKAPLLLPAQIVTGLIWLGAALVLVHSIIWLTVSPKVGGQDTHFVSVITAPGDSLWSIARSCSSSSERVDDRIAQIESLNPGLDTHGMLMPGRRIKIPMD